MPVSGVNAQAVGTVVSYLSMAAIVFTVVYKGLPKFLEIYIAAQENIRRDLQRRVELLEGTLSTERRECEEKISNLWLRIEKMRQIVNHLLVNRQVNLTDTEVSPISGILHRAYDLPPEIAAAVEEMNAMPGTGESVSPAS